jgi:eukaryotic-like serine/threonine-protein kinase
MSTTGDLLDGRYRLGLLLGRGGMSDVFRATDEVFGTEVAIKIVRSPDAEYARRSALEAQALRRFQHPGLVQLLETGVSGDMTYLVMEFVDGESLATMIHRGHLSTGETADIGATLAGALAYVHAQGVVHRDVKPANILIDTERHARLADFGIARLVDTSSVTLTGTMIGTATYMAPEQIEDHAVGPSADVWSLGIVLLESLTGERVYVGTPSEVIARRLAGPVTLPEGLPVPWRLLFSGMLALEPDDRLSATEVQAMLSTPAFRAPWDPTASTGDITTIAGSPPRQRGSAADETRVAPPRVSVMSRQPTTNAVNVRRGWRALAIASIVIVVGAAIAFAFGTGNHHPPPTSSTLPTTTVPPTTTTTALPTPSHALTTFINDVVAGQTAKLIGPQVGQSLSMGAQQAVIDAGNGNADLAATDLQQVATTIATGVSSGHIAKASGVLLQSDLTILAKALGLGAAATPSSTTTSTSSTTTTVPNNGFGGGPGN